MDPSQPITTKQYFSGLFIIFIALIAGQIFFALIAWYLTVDGGMGTDPEFSEVFMVLVPIFTAGGIAGGFIVFKNRLKSIQRSEDLNEKLNNYRSALILKYAMWEMPAFFSLVSLLLTGDLIFLGFAVLPMVLHLFHRPSKQAVISQLELNPGEINALEDESFRVV